MRGEPLTRYAWLSVVAALGTILTKVVAALITGSVGLFSDAVESAVNLIGALMALAMLAVAARPADEDHTYGHSKAEYFSSGLEGGLILLAGFGIVVAAGHRLVRLQALEAVGEGLALAGAAALINLWVAWVLLRAGRRFHSITLEANAHHLLTDVWTSVGVILGVGLVGWTGWSWLDPVVALAVGANILHTGYGIVRRSVMGLMDSALAEADVAAVRAVLDRYKTEEAIDYHALRTRQAGARKFVSVHVLVPGQWTVHQGHALLERIESDIRRAVPESTVFTHLEALDDPRSWEDQELDRRPTNPQG
ncbi:MAG: cation diffusion facilitator family transporter [Verrucomicrobiota bacterium]|nr:cation diffusion facilitator family transporter [Limisphaera sp.]MDW8382607.1 cation diffusion facilitator family transporter [Verrucomicrobiota bacterium]